MKYQHHLTSGYLAPLRFAQIAFDKFFYPQYVKQRSNKSVLSTISSHTVSNNASSPPANSSKTTPHLQQ